MNTNVAKLEPKELTPIQDVTREVGRMGQQLKSVLPSHIDPAKFQRVAMTAIQADPDLLNADRASLYTALTKAASDGLMPDKREGALTIANTKVKVDGRDVWIKMVVWMPMVAGITKKVRQSGEVAKMIAKAVYEKDEFDVLFGDDDRIYHKPFLEGHPGKIIGAYSIVHLKDGSISRDFMPKWRIDKAKNVAKTKFVWDAWEDEMSIKTVIRHHAKLLPQSTDIEAAFQNDDTQQFDMAAAMLTGPQAAPAGPITGQALLAQANDDVPDEEQAEVAHDDATNIIESAADAEARALAENFLASYKKDLAKVATRDGIAAFQARRKEPLDDLRADFPYLAAQADEALSARLKAWDDADAPELDR